MELGRLVRYDAHGLQDRVHEAVQPLDLVHRALVPRGAGRAALRVPRRAAVEVRLLREQVRVGADDGERRPELVGHEGDQLVARLVQRRELGDLRLGLALEPALLDDPGQQVGDGRELGDVLRREVPPLLGLDVEHADDLVVPGERDRQHRGDEPPLVEAADPQEARVLADVGDRDGLGGSPRRAR